MLFPHDLQQLNSKVAVVKKKILQAEIFELIVVFVGAKCKAKAAKLAGSC